MNKLYMLLLILSVLVGSFGQILLKVGADKLHNLTFSLSLWSIPREIYSVLRIAEISGGLFLFTISSIMWIKVLTKAELSTAYPMVSLGYVNVALFSYFFFHETFTLTKLLGMALIIIGVIVLNS